MAEKNRINLSFREDVPAHRTALERILENRGTEKYQSTTDYVAAAVNGFEETDGKDGQGTTGKEELARYLADEIEKRIRPLIRGPVGK